MLTELVNIKRTMEELMDNIRAYRDDVSASYEERDERFQELWDKAESVNEWAFNAFMSGKLPHAIARLISADCIDNDVNMETWHTLMNIICNADILLKGVK